MILLYNILHCITMLLQAPVDRFLRPVCPEIWLLVGKIRKRTQSNIKAWYEY